MVCQKMCEALAHFFFFFFSLTIIIFDLALLYRHIVDIPMGTNCAPLVADSFLFCYERNFMMSLSGDKEAEIIEALNSTSRYLDNLLNIDNTYFDGMSIRFTHQNFS